MQAPYDSSQPSTSKVRDGEISLTLMIDTPNANTDEDISFVVSRKHIRGLWRKLLLAKGLT